MVYYNIVYYYIIYYSIAKSKALYYIITHNFQLKLTRNPPFYVIRFKMSVFAYNKETIRCHLRKLN